MIAPIPQNSYLPVTLFMNATYHPDDSHSSCRKAARILIASLLCLAAGPHPANAQNPVPNNTRNFIANPSFEDVNTCLEYNQPCSPSAWFFANRKVTSGYFPRFPSATGYRHLQIVVASRETTNRQYWETMLLCPLQAGEKYTVTFKITAINSRPNLRDFGCWFTDRFIFSGLDTLLQPRTYLKFTDAVTRDLKNGWLEITKEFTPSRNASFLIIGNFYPAANADIMDQRQRPEGTIEIGIDDMAITSAKGSLCPEYTAVKDILYSITRRHSEIDPRELKPRNITPPTQNPPSGQTPGRDTAARTIPPGRDTGARTTPTPDRPTDTTAHNPAPPPSKTDTLVIHNIQFEFDRYLVDNPDTLLRYRKILTRPGIKKIEVVGYTDDKGTEAYNKDLSEKRAHEVARLLTTKFGIDPALIQTEGRGISKDYKDSNLNRRVEIYIFH